MQEEVTQKTIALVIKTAKLDANVLKAAIKMYLNHRKQKAQKAHGKTSVKKLVGEGVGVSSIEITDGNERLGKIKRANSNPHMATAKNYAIPFVRERGNFYDLHRSIQGAYRIHI